MAAPEQDYIVEENASTCLRLGRRASPTPSTFSEDVRSETAGPSTPIEARAQGHVQDNSTMTPEYQVQTLIPDQPKTLDKEPTVELSQNIEDQNSLQPPDTARSETSRDSGYFTSQHSQGSQVVDFAPSASPSSSSTPLKISVSPMDSPTPVPSDDHQVPSIGSSEHESGLPPKSGATRPTSVPNFHSKPPHRRREGPDYPNYPDQSFKALQNPHIHSSYGFDSPRPLRTRSSHLSQHSSISSNDSQFTKDLPRVLSGAKTAGNTPAQSPGLFSPTFPAKRQWPGDPEDRRSGTPMLHPTHHRPPKETHKLLKDIDPISGRKTINHYEIFQKLGSGQHGTVKQGRDMQNGGMVAIKIVRRFSKKMRLGRSGDPNDTIKKEVAIFKKARHPHVVSLIEVIDDDEFGKVYLVLEFVERGEIIWRKQTDKDIAYFEMERSQREIMNIINEDFERRVVAHFNLGAPTRRLEKARLLEQQKREAREHYKIHGRRSEKQPKSDFWSLEFEPEVEFDPDFDLEGPSELEQALTQRLADGSLTFNLPKTPPQNESPSHTPKPPLQLAVSGSAPTSIPSSRPITPTDLEGTMYEPYLDENLSDLAVKSTLDEIIAGQTHWAPDEEDFRYVPCLTSSQALDAFRDTVLGLEYLHYQGIIHRDIKPANLLWTTDYRVKISDFGVSYLGKPMREDDKQSDASEDDTVMLDEALELAKTVGTPAFYAPELCDPQYFEIGKHPERPAITGQIDVWALGVTLYGMIFGRLPFYHPNEFKMYERIAREEVFIPRVRLKGVEHTDKTPSNQNKRLDDVLEYEDVDDELRDLLRRLLDKQPSKRITLKEVKHHPWVLRGIKDQMLWVDETDPSVQSQGRKIEVSTQEVQDAVIGLTLVDRVKAGFQRVGSVLRGRNSRKRADSTPKPPETKPLEPFIPMPVPERKRVQPTISEARRRSIRGDEKIYTALRASREGFEHPLAHSIATTPVPNDDPSHLDDSHPPRPLSDPQANRPTLMNRTLSTTDSMKTIRAPVSTTLEEWSPADLSLSDDGFSTATTIPDHNPASSSSFGGIFGGAGRRLVNSMRSRERGLGRQSPSQTSRSSSVDRDRDDPHASPSLALSSAIAAGHVDQPPALREEVDMTSQLLNESSVEAFRYARDESGRRQVHDYQNHSRRPTVSLAAEIACPPSPEDDAFFTQPRPVSVADSSTAFQVSSSSDRIVSGESTPHSRIPSVVSGASSLSATVEGLEDPRALHLEKSVSPFIMNQKVVPHAWNHRSDEALNTKPALAPSVVEEEAGYNGEGEQDSDSDDEGLAMA